MILRICEVEGCEVKHMAKGFCASHYMSKYNETRRAKKCEYMILWRKNNAEYNKNWKDQNRDLVVEYNKAYQKQYKIDKPEIIGSAHARRRQREKIKVTSEVRAASAQMRKDLAALPCVFCGCYSDNPHIDHATPLSRGGIEHPGNLLPACANCNLRKHTKTAEEFIEFLDKQRTAELPAGEES